MNGQAGMPDPQVKLISLIHYKDAVMWRISDVKSRQHDFPLAIFVLSPKLEQHDYQQINSTYQETINTYLEMGADIVKENDAESWVLSQIKSLTGQLPKYFLMGEMSKN